MPPRGVKKGTKRARQYEHVKKSEKEQGRGEPRRGDRGAHGQQGEGEIGRIAQQVANLDGGHVLGPAMTGEQLQRAVAGKSGAR